MIFENGKEITRICENGKDIIARYCEGHLLWSSGIKLKSLLGKQNTEQSITLSSPLNLNTAVGFGMSGNGITYPNNLWGGSYGKPIEIKETHYYLYAIKVNKNVLSTANTWGGFYFATQGGYIDNQTMAYTDGEWYLGIQKANKSLINDNFFGIFARSLALNTGDIITCYKSFILDLTQAKLDTLTAEQVYNLITLNGTDFTNLELLGAGYEIKLGSFKSQDKLIEGGLSSETAQFYYDLFFSTLGMSKMYVPYGKRFESSDNIILGTKYGIVDMSKIYYSYQSGNNRFYSSGIQNIVKYTQGDTASVPNIYIDGLEAISLNTMGSGTTHDYSITIYNGLIFVRVLQYTQPNDLINFFKGKYLIFPLATPNSTDYNDLSAKEMYDVINDNVVDILANGKSIGGVRNLLGKQNVATKKKNTGFYKCHTDNTWKENFNSEETSKIATLNTSHKYCCIIHATDVSNSEYEMGNIAYKENALAWASISNVNLFRDTEYISITFNCADTKVRFGYMGNTNATIYSQVVIDLTEHNLQNLTAQEAYQYFKENNLNILDNRGEIDIGGYIKS